MELRYGTINAKKRKAGLVGPASSYTTFGELLGYEDSPQISNFIKKKALRFATKLHHQRQVLEFQLQHGHGAPGHFYSADGIHGCLGRNAVTSAHEEHLNQFGCLAGVNQAPLE